MRRTSVFILAVFALAFGPGLSFGQSADEDLKYYEATTASGAEVPRPHAGCELAQFGSRSLWACQRVVEMPIVGRYGANTQSDGSGDSGMGSSGGGMDGSRSEGGGMNN